MKVINKIFWCLLVFSSVSVFGQEESETIGTETIDVVKLYNPTISDANKIVEKPEQKTEIKEELVPLEYQIFSYPVASTYRPSKGKAARLTKAEKEKLFANYLVLGFGNYSTPLFDFYSGHKLDNESYFVADVHHLSSQGGIKDVQLDNSYYDTKLRATYGVNKRTKGWDIGVGYQHQLYNWYGIPTDSNIFVFSNTALNQLSPSQIYQSVDVKGGMYSNKNKFRKSAIAYNHFWDAKGSAENRFYVMPTFDFVVVEQKIKTDFVVDYVGGNFDRGYMSQVPSEYGALNVGVQPSVIYRKDDFSFNIGGGIFYSANTSNSTAKNKLYVYPQVTGSLKVVEGVLTAYAGLEGGLRQNSYNQITKENPFVSPTLFIMPTDKAYDISIGLRGDLSKKLSFNVKGFFQYERGKYLFRTNLFEDGPIDQRQDYEFANSYSVVYDNVSTTGITGELTYDWEKKLKAKVYGTFAGYGTKSQAQAWNLPQLKGGLSLDYHFLKKWNIISEMYYIGSRKDLEIVTYIPSNVTYGETTVDGFFDVNLKTTYQYSKKLAGFIQLNNLTSQSYQQWVDYPTQQFQFLIGGTYKFDF